MSWIAVAIVGGSVLGGAVSAHGAQSAANTQANAANNAAAVQQHMFDTTREDQRPYREAGYSSLADIMAQMNGGTGAFKNPVDIGGLPPDFFTHTFDANDLKTNLAPNYDFMLKQGQGATTNMANAMGGLGGNSLKAINDYTQDYAGNAYQQAFNNYNAQRGAIFDRFNTQQTNIFNRLASIAGLGQTAGANSTTGGSAFASGIANSLQGAGNAQAAGQVGAANAISGGINNGMNAYLLSTFLNRGAGAAAAGAG